MTHALFLSPTGRRGRWLQLRKARRGAAMVQPLRGPGRGQPAKVYCDPRMPDSWSQISE